MGIRSFLNQPTCSAVVDKMLALFFFLLCPLLDGGPALRKFCSLWFLWALAGSCHFQPLASSSPPMETTLSSGAVLVWSRASTVSPSRHQLRPDLTSGALHVQTKQTVVRAAFPPGRKSKTASVGEECGERGGGSEGRVVLGRGEWCVDREGWAGVLLWWCLSACCFGSNRQRRMKIKAPQNCLRGCT